MNLEGRQYRLVRLAAITFGFGGFMLLAALSIRLWPAIHQVLQPAALRCGCAAATAVPPTVLVATGVVILAALILPARFVYFFVRHLRRGRRLVAEWTKSGSRRIRHHGLREEVIVLNRPGQAAVTLGIIRPKIYLTADLLRRLTGSEVLAVLRHEQAHRRRFDPLWLAVLSSLSVAWWRLPWLERLVESSVILRELSADAVATANYRQTTGLSGAILKLLETPPAEVAAFSPNQYRVEKLLDHAWQPRLRLWRWSYLWGLASAVVFIGLMLRSAPPAAARQPAAAAACREVRVSCRQVNPWAVTASPRCSGGDGCSSTWSSSMSVYVYPWTPD